MTLKNESFVYAYELCDFVNDWKVKAEQLLKEI